MILISLCDTPILHLYLTLILNIVLFKYIIKIMMEKYITHFFISLITYRMDY